MHRPPGPARRAGACIDAVFGVALWMCGAGWAMAASRPGVDDIAGAPAVPPGLSAPELSGKNVHTVGRILLHVTNFGLFGSLPGTNARYAGAPSAQWPPGSGIEYLFAGGLWVGADLRGEHRVSGLIETPGRVAFEFRPRTDASAHIYRAREGAPGGARQPARNADDDGDRAVDEDPLDGRDNDGDGAIDEDFAAISEQMFTCEFADDDPGIALTEPDHRPLGLHIRQSTFAWENDHARNAIGFDYEILNRGRDALTDVYVGLMTDFNIGSRELDSPGIDDLGGFWEGSVDVGLAGTPRTVHLEVAYAFDDDGDDGHAPGYVGLVFLGTQTSGDEGVNRPLHMRNCRFFAGTAPFDVGGDPTNDPERYAVLEGSSPHSLGPFDLQHPRPQFTLTQRADYRTVVSAGPFPALPPGGTLRFQAALVIGDNFESLLERAARVRILHDGGWEDCDHDPATGIRGRETPLCAPAHDGLYAFNPCDTNCPPFDHACGAGVPDGGCIWVNYDCAAEDELGATGVDGRETWVPWRSSTSPPPPGLRVAAYEDRVELYWDATSETTPDPLTGDLDFESYRVWRADGWTRPPGTDAQTGPPEDLWAVLAEYDVAGNQLGADTGLEALHYEPAIPDNAVQFYRLWNATHPGEPAPALPGFTAAQLDTAKALAQGRRYRRFVDPPFVNGAPADLPCPASGRCPPLDVGGVLQPARCDATGHCRAVIAGPHPGAHLFYAVTCSDHVRVTDGGRLRLAPGLSGLPSGNFVYVVPPTTSLPAARAAEAAEEIYVVPNPATRESLAPWRLSPNNNDPTGVKVEFHHLPRAPGRVTLWTLAGDRVQELAFDGRDGNGTLAWNLVSRNGQDVASGVYLYTVESELQGFQRVTGKLVVIR